jgi:ribosomal protein S19
MARSRWKVPYFSKYIWKTIFKIYKGLITNNINRSVRDLTIYSRSSSIPRSFNKINVKIHKGSKFRFIKISKLMASFKFGEFAYTRKLNYYPLRKKYRR